MVDVDPHTLTLKHIIFLLVSSLFLGYRSEFFGKVVCKALAEGRRETCFLQAGEGERIILDVSTMS